MLAHPIYRPKLKCILKQADPPQEIRRCVGAAESRYAPLPGKFRAAPREGRARHKAGRNFARSHVSPDSIWHLDRARSGGRCLRRNLVRRAPRELSSTLHRPNRVFGDMRTCAFARGDVRLFRGFFSRWSGSGLVLNAGAEGGEEDGGLCDGRAGRWVFYFRDFLEMLRFGDRE